MESRSNKRGITSSDESNNWENFQNRFTDKWVRDFETDTAAWYKSLISTEPCLVCGISPDLILQVSKLIPAELEKAREEGRHEMHIKYMHAISEVLKDNNGIK